MPTGTPNTQTKATEKYQKKAGYVAKTFKLKKDIVEEFAQCCEAEGVSQASIITGLMREYIDRKNKK